MADVVKRFERAFQRAHMGGAAVRCACCGGSAEECPMVTGASATCAGGDCACFRARCAICGRRWPGHKKGGESCRAIGYGMLLDQAMRLLATFDAGSQAKLALHYPALFTHLAPACPEGEGEGGA